MNTKTELFELCKDRAEELAHAAEGNLYLIDGCREVIKDLDAYMEAHEGEDEPQAVTVADILGEDSLGDLHFEVNQRGELYNGKTIVAFGGPNVWIDCDEVRGYWGTDEERYTLSPNAREAVMDWFAEQWDCARSAM